MKNISFYKKVSFLLVLVLVFGFFYSYRLVSRSVDFDINYKAGCLVREDKIEYVLTDEFPHKYPPLTGLYFSLYCIPSHNVSRIIFFWVSLAAVIASFLIGMKLTNNESLLTGFLIPLLLVLRPVLWEFDLGNSNHLILLGLMIAIYLYKREKLYLSSLFMIMAATAKLFPGLIFVYFIIKKQYKYLVYSLLNFILIIFIIPAIFYGFWGAIDRIIMWTRALFGNQFWTVYDHANQSVLGLLARFFTDTPYKINFISLSKSSLYILYAIIFTLAVVGLCWYLYKNRNKENDYGIAITIALSVILSPLCWIQTFMVSIYMLQIISPYAIRAFKIAEFRKTGVYALLGWAFSQLTNPELMGNSLEDKLLSMSVMLIGWGFYMLALYSLFDSKHRT